jgi:PPM family protein phosphatase
MNQDAISICDPSCHPTATRGYLYALADGMGGYEHGAVASTLALDLLFRAFYSTAGKAGDALRRGVIGANMGVYQEAQRLTTRMGTTLTAVSITHDRLWLAHVGDSRAYLVRRNQVTCLTNDHTAVADLVRMRIISPDKLRTHAQRSVLNRCLGLNLFVQPDISQVKTQPGDTIILCSDGVWSAVQDDEFAQIASREPEPGALGQRLIDLAVDRENEDDLSVIAISLTGALPKPMQAECRHQLWRVRL